MDYYRSRLNSHYTQQTALSIVLKQELSDSHMFNFDLVLIIGFYILSLVFMLFYFIDFYNFLFSTFEYFIVVICGLAKILFIVVYFWVQIWLCMQFGCSCDKQHQKTAQPSVRPLCIHAFIVSKSYVVMLFSVPTPECCLVIIQAASSVLHLAFLLREQKKGLLSTVCPRP